jgi:hypothetical protein
MPPRTPSRRNGAGRSSQFDDDLPVYGIPSSSANPTSGVGPNGGIRPGSGLVPGSTSRKSSENQNHNLNHLLGLRMPPRAVVGSGMGSSTSAGSAVTPRRSRGIKNSFNKDSESESESESCLLSLLRRGELINWRLTLRCQPVNRIRQCPVPIRHET